MSMISSSTGGAFGSVEVLFVKMLRASEGIYAGGAIGLRRFPQARRIISRVRAWLSHDCGRPPARARAAGPHPGALDEIPGGRKRATLSSLPR